MHIGRSLIFLISGNSSDDNTGIDFVYIQMQDITSLLTAVMEIPDIDREFTACDRDTGQTVELRSVREEEEQSGCSEEGSNARRQTIIFHTHQPFFSSEAMIRPAIPISRIKAVVLSRLELR